MMRTALKLVVQQFSVLKGGLVSITAFLSAGDELPLPNKPVGFYANEKPIGTETTDTRGEATVVWDTSRVTAGNYVITASYAGDEESEGSSNTVQITVQEQVMPEQITGAVVGVPVNPPAKERDALVQLVSNTEHCIDNCRTVYHICPGGNGAESFDLAFKDRSGKAAGALHGSARPLLPVLRGSSFHARELQMDYRADVPVEVPVYEPCQRSVTRISNETGEEETVLQEASCQAGTRTVFVSGTVWEPFIPNKINGVPGCFDLRIKGKIDWDDWVDNVISFAGYTYDEYAAWVGDVIVHTVTEDFNGTGTNVTNASDQLAAFTPDSITEDFTRADQYQWGNNWTNGSSNLAVFTNPRWNITNNRGYAEGANIENPSFSKHVGARQTFDFQADFFVEQGDSSGMAVGIGFGSNIRCGITDQPFVCYKLNYVKSVNELRLLDKSKVDQTVIATAPLNVDLSAGVHRLRFRFNGSQLFGKLWNASAPEPVQWMVNGSVQAPEASDHLLNLETDPGPRPNITFYWDNVRQIAGGNQSAQWTYASQAIDTGTNNRSLRINVSANNASAFTFEARVAGSSAALENASFFAFSHNTDLAQQGQFVQYRLNASQGSAVVYEVNISRASLRYPSNITEDTGNDAQIDFRFPGTLDNTNSPQLVDLNATAINAFLATCAADENDVCTVPLNFTANSPPESQTVSLRLPRAANVTISRLNITGIGS